MTEEKCPICCEDLDLTDLSFKPCKCGYQVCLWCYKDINEKLNGRCPACRAPYKDQGGFTAPDPVKLQNEIRRTQAAKQKKKEKRARVTTSVPMDRKLLSTMRVLQRNLVYVVGLTVRVAKEEMLRKKQYLGKYGKLLKIVVNKKVLGNGTTSYCAYVTFKNPKDAELAIRRINGSVIDGARVRATYGTTKYCTNFLKNANCTNPSCLYLHHLARDEDCFSKEALSNVDTFNYQELLELSRKASMATSLKQNPAMSSRKSTVPEATTAPPRPAARRSVSTGNSFENRKKSSPSRNRHSPIQNPRAAPKKATKPLEPSLYHEDELETTIPPGNSPKKEKISVSNPGSTPKPVPETHNPPTSKDEPRDSKGIESSIPKPGEEELGLEKVTPLPQTSHDRPPGLEPAEPPGLIASAIDSSFFTQLAASPGRGGSGFVVGNTSTSLFQQPIGAGTRENEMWKTEKWGIQPGPSGIPSIPSSQRSSSRFVQQGVFTTSRQKAVNPSITTPARTPARATSTSPPNKWNFDKFVKDMLPNTPNEGFMPGFGGPGPVGWRRQPDNWGSGAGRSGSRYSFVDQNTRYSFGNQGRHGDSKASPQDLTGIAGGQQSDSSKLAKPEDLVNDLRAMLPNVKISYTPDRENAGRGIEAGSVKRAQARGGRPSDWSNPILEPTAVNAINSVHHHSMQLSQPHTNFLKGGDMRQMRRFPNSTSTNFGETKERNGREAKISPSQDQFGPPVYSSDSTRPRYLETVGNPPTGRNFGNIPGYSNAYRQDNVATRQSQMPRNPSLARQSQRPSSWNAAPPGFDPYQAGQSPGVFSAGDRPAISRFFGETQMADKKRLIDPFTHVRNSSGVAAYGRTRGGQH